MNEWIIKIIDAGWKNTREIYIFRKKHDDGMEMLDGRVIKKGALGKSFKPTLELEPEQLQALADELDKIGYKPQKGFMEGKLSATEKHLEDMRDLVFKDNNNDKNNPKKSREDNV